MEAICALAVFLMLSLYAFHRGKRLSSRQDFHAGMPFGRRRRR